MNSSDIVSDYFTRANEAADQGKFELAIKTCLDAAVQFERIDAEREASKAYHLLGELAYRQNDLDSAESWCRKALLLDERSGVDNTLDYARTCNNLGVISTAKEDFIAAEHWLHKSIRLKQSLGDEIGIAASYRQLGVLAKTKIELESAENWFLKSMAITERQGDVPSKVLTALDLANVAVMRGDNDAATNWRTIFLEALGDDVRPSSLINLGSRAQRGGDLETARLLFEKAFEIATNLVDEESQSFSSLRMGNMACQMGDYASARDHYIRSIKIDERLDLTGRAAVSCANLGRIYMVGGNGIKRDFQTAKTWFRKSLTLTRDVSLCDILVLNASLMYRRMQVFIKANSSDWELIQEEFDASR